MKRFGRRVVVEVGSLQGHAPDSSCPAEVRLLAPTFDRAAESPDEQHRGCMHSQLKRGLQRGGRQKATDGRKDMRPEAALLGVLGGDGLGLLVAREAEVGLDDLRSFQVQHRGQLASPTQAQEPD